MTDQRVLIEFVVGDGEAHARVTDGLSGGNFELLDASLDVEHPDERDILAEAYARDGYKRWKKTGECVITIRGRVKR